MRNVLISTTINEPVVLTQWAQHMNEDDMIIIAGDHKSPHEKIRDLLADVTATFDIPTRYIHPEAQNVWDVSELIGWNCIQRRNIALLEAIRMRPEFITTIDDDNWPTDENNTQLERLMNTLNSGHKSNHTALSSLDGWFNPGDLCVPGVVHRGYPLRLRQVDPHLTDVDVPKLGVAAMLWLEEPDIDAVERICCAPLVREVPEDAALAPGTWAPFNSQATMYRGELAPLMFMWPGVGRYDDIWASYLARRAMDHFGYGVFYGEPSVRQERNPHNLITDLEAELFGMKHNDLITDALRAIVFNSSITTPLKAFEHITTSLMNNPAIRQVLPTNTLYAMSAWAADVTRILGV